MSLIMFGGGPITVSGNFTTASMQDNCKPGNSWKIVVPEATTNYIKNPSAETTANYSAYGTALVTRVSSVQKYGLYSYFVQTIAANDGLVLDLETLTLSSPYFLTVRVKGDLPDLTAALDGGAVAKLRFIERIDREWILMGCQFSADLAVSSTQLAIYTTETGLFDIYLDGIQLEPHGFWTTYCDGTQEGCAWTGTAHASISTRSGQSRAGGVVKDFFDTYGFFLKHVVGAGVPPIDINIDEYAILPGGEFNSEKIQPRYFTLVGEFYGNDEPDLHEKRQALEQAFSSDLVPGNQPVRIRFSGAKVQKEISVRYKSGLEGDLATFYRNFEAGDDKWTRLQSFNEKATIQLVAPDPFWYEVGESAVLLSSVVSDTFNLVATKSYATGLWSSTGPFTVGGTYNRASALAEDAQYIYIGGNFANFNGIANADNIVRYNKVTGVYSALDVGLPDPVNALAIDPSTGYLYAASFNAGPDTASLDVWNGSAWNNVTTANNAINSICFDRSNILYAAGSFTVIDGNAITGIAWNDAGTWTALGGATNDAVNVVAADLINDLIYIGGAFTTVNAVSAAKIAVYNLVTDLWSALSSGMNNDVYTIKVTPTGSVLAGGSFTTAGGVTANRTAEFRGSGWYPLGNGMADAIVSDIEIGIDGTVYASGTFTEAGGLIIADRIAAWNGYSWAHLDIDLPGTPNVLAILSAKSGDLWLGFDTTGTGYYSGATAVQNDGTAKSFPRAIYTRSGGTTAIIEWLRNNRTSDTILLNYSLLDAETLIANMLPVKKSVISSVFGLRLNAILPSNFGSWSLLPGQNIVSSFVSSDATLLTYLLWQDTYKSYD